MPHPKREIRSSAEPLTLWRRHDVRALLHGRTLRTEIEAGRLARLLVDPHIAKVLPTDRRVTVEPHDDVVVRVVTSAYHRYTDEPMYALRGVLDPFHGACTPGAGRAPSRERVITRLLELLDTPYLFGGTSEQGSVRQRDVLLELGAFAAEDFEHAELDRIARSHGVDCSGLLNAATDGFFIGDSRDTVQLGPVVAIREGTSADEVARMLEPLDVLVWKGHMVVALGDGRIIQSVGDGKNANAFFAECGGADSAWQRYNRVAIDEDRAILNALEHRLGLRPASDWPPEPGQYVIVRCGQTFAH